MGGVIYAEANKKHLLEIKQDVEASSGVVFDLKKKRRNTGTIVAITATFLRAREDLI